MDFFEAQARAKQRTQRLVALFALAVVGTIVAGYLMAIFGLAQVDKHQHRSNRRDYVYEEVSPSPPLWQPRVFVAVTLGTLVVVGCASLFKWSEFRQGGSAVAESVGGRKVDPHTTDLHERQLLNVVEEMSIASGVPMPVVYVLDDEPAINAFAAGLTTSDAVVTVTRGAMEKLTRDELQGVIGHEFSHILNGDMRLNVKLSAILFGILVLGIIGRGIVGSLRYTRSRDRNSGGFVVVLLAVGSALLLLGYVGYFFGRLIQAAVSRQREFLADASSVQFTRNPAGLTGALKKIGGYALGSSIQSSKGTAIGHFFFAQGFQSMFGGAWATHPPLDVRIRAIDPQFDGKFFEPKETVDVAHEAWTRPGQPGQAAGFAPGALAHSRALPPVADNDVDRLLANVGRLSPAAVANAQDLLASTPARLLAAARNPAEAPVLLYGLLLNDEPEVRSRQRATVAGTAGSDALRVLDELDPALRQLQPGHRLPLLQLALPALRSRPAGSLGAFFGTLDDLVHADGQVSPFEFALQKLLLRTLAVGQAPASAVVQIYSFNAVVDEIAVVLSAVAHASDEDPAAAAPAFAAGAAQLRLLDGRLALLPPGSCGFAQLDTALDKLATASGPIKQRLLTAAAHVVSSDGRILVAEAELLRAIAATLDVPMPPLAAKNT
ncbi:MAG TPA: M48 family metallopeptidase [Opitutaceae bacterium]|nr:M48 family metallopeptidase [Opitutaceae bacterium]